MTQPRTTPSRISFGLFEADLKSGELWKAGYRVRLQSLPFRILTVLVENAGEVVSREDLQQRVWGPDVVVDFEHSLSSAIKKLREALGDSADNPRFIETLARRGYRFLAPVRATDETPVESTAAAGLEAPEVLAAQRVVQGSAPIWWKRGTVWIPVAAFAVGVMLASVVVLHVRGSHLRSSALPRMTQITHEGRPYTSVDETIEALPASVTDGTHLFTSTIEAGVDAIAQINIATGEMQLLHLPSEIASPEINNISPDGMQLLVRGHLSAVSEGPLWIVPIDGASAFRVANLVAHDATWMPDGRSILYAAGNQLSVYSLDKGVSTPFAQTPGRAFWLRWSPDGKLLRFTIIDTARHTATLWQMSQSRLTPQQILPHWMQSPLECCGVWTADGQRYVFQAGENGNTDLWQLEGTETEQPARVTNGPLYFEAPAAGRHGGKIYFVGNDYRSHVERFDMHLKEFVPLEGFLAFADHISYSHDQKRVVWLDPVGRLWRSDIDGSDRVQLTPESLHVYMAVWSPKGDELALMARGIGQPWQLFRISAEGGTPELLMSGSRNVGDPTWSADGRQIAFGGVSDRMGQGNSLRSLQILDVESKRVSEIPGSEGLFSPRWSPDGRLIAALSFDQQRLMLYDVATHNWRVLATTSVADPVWANDGRSVFAHNFMAAMSPIVRISVPEGRIEIVGSLRDFRRTSAARYYFSGITPSNEPLVHAEIDNSNIYSMDVTGEESPQHR